MVFFLRRIGPTKTLEKIQEVFINMYGDEYKHNKSGKEVKEKEDKSSIYKDKSQKVKGFVPSLEITKKDKKRAFTPSLSPEPKQKRTDFTPSMELPKESKQKRFMPTLDIDTNKKRRNFTPSFEMSEKKKRNFIPDYHLKDEKKLSNNKKKFEDPSKINVILKEEIKNNCYSIKDLTNELIEELSKYPEEMYKLNPNRVLRDHSGYTLKDLSKLWGHHEGYVSERLLYHQNNSDYILPKINLEELQINLKNEFGSKANYCYKLINSHKEGNLSFSLLIGGLQKELGKISESVRTTLEDLGLLFGYGYGMMNYIRHNDNFLLSKRRLSILKDNVELILENKANNVLKIIGKYEKQNPDLLDYANQKYIITKPNFFSDIYKKPDTMYWLGWLCSDGWISPVGNSHYRIQLTIKREDRKILERFATAIGYEQDRIFDEKHFFKDKNGILRARYSSRIIFGCKPMWLELKKLGIFDFKNQGKVPQVIKDLIDKAKRKKINGQLIETREGRLALRFLIGFYDGDGNYRGGMSARITNTKKRFLEELKDLFDISNEININNKKVIDKKTGKVIWKTRYQLHLGPELFKQMLLSHKNSLQRKRPEKFRINI